MALRLIVKREFFSKIRNKSFILMTFISPLLMVFIIVLVSFLNSNNSSEAIKIAVCDESNQVVSQFESKDNIHYEDVSPIGISVMKELMPTSNYQGLVLVKKNDSITDRVVIEYFSKETPSLDLLYKIEDQIETILTNNKLIKIKVDPLVLEKAKVDVDITLFNLTGGDNVRGLNEIKMFIGGAFGYLIMMFIVIYGNFVMRSVIEEKTNRIIEVIISSVKPLQLMLGKIIGTSLAGLLQFFIWVILGGCLLLLISYSLDVPLTGTIPTSQLPVHMNFELKTLLIELRQLPLVFIISSFIVYFIGGYLLYSSFYAAIGAAVDSETDSQQFLLPIISPLIIGVYVGLFTVVSDPHGWVATIFSYIPFTSPIVMLMRIPFGVPWWEILLSLLVLFITFMVVVWFASRIYKVGILMYGRKPTYKELFKWIKY